MNDAEKMELTSFDVAQEKRAELKACLNQAFPEIFAEGTIDFDQLRRALGDWIDAGKERFGLNWPGKAECMKIVQQPSVGTLRPARNDSVNFDDTGNLLIEGDNLEVLKLLQKAYFGKVKMIYIDPPYNTGNDLIYPDNYAESLQTYLEYTGQTDAEGRRFGTNAETEGRFHSKWLNMMHPRLYLARNLLRADGLIFVSIDDNEEANLRKLMNEIFGEENICATFVWNTEGHTDNQYAIKVNHEYIFAYYRDASLRERAIGRVVDPNTRKESNVWKGLADNNINKNGPENPPDIVELPAGFPCTEKELVYRKKALDDTFFSITRRAKYVSDEIKSKYGIEKLSGLPVKLDDMVVKQHALASPCRVYGGMANRNKLLEFIANGCKPIVDDDGSPLRFYINANAAIRYHREIERPRHILSVLRNLGTTELSRSYLRQLGLQYDYPKPLPLIEYLLKIGCEDPDGLILDFFAGSGTTGQAALALNKQDGGNRKFILVQLPEPTEQQDQKTIVDITKERMRRVVGKIDEETDGQLPLEGETPQDLGFRAFRLAESNFKTWEADTPRDTESLSRQLELHVDHVREGRTADDLLYEILLKSGFPLNTHVKELTLAGKSVLSIADGALLICLEKEITPELLDALADATPLQVICLDEAFKGNDQLKANAVQTFKARAQAEESEIVFRTV